MQKDPIRIVLLSIAASGVMLAVAGVAFYLSRDFILRRDLARFLSPLPPLLVAAYVFVVSFFDHFGNDPAAAGRHAVVETLAATALSAALFFVLSLGVILVVALVWRLLA